MTTISKIKSGVNKLANPVKLTLGTKGRTVMFVDDNGKPHITKDGVTVARHIRSDDNFENMVISVLREASMKTMLSSGDGPQPLWSKVLTPNGFVKMGDIKIGDKVCGTDGSIQTVVGVFDKGEKEIYNVHFSDKRIVECCADHLWQVVNTSASVNKHRVMTTMELMNTDKVACNKHGYTKHSFYTPRTFVEFKERELPLDPYILGVLLGDGSLSGTGAIELSLGKSKEHILNTLVLPESCSFNYTYDDKKNYFRVKTYGLEQTLKELGLYGTNSHTKFIPEIYLYSNLESRKRLLQGLLDTDGYINKRGLFEFSTVSDKLKDDFMTLTRSLGYSLNYKLHTRDTPIHRINQLKGYKYGDKIVKIEPTGVFTDMQCIKVSNDDCLYITDNFIVTHNTTTSMILAQHLIIKGLELMEEGLSYYDIAKQMDLALKDVVEYIRNESIDVSIKPELLREIASISANDEKIGDFVYSIIQEIGLYGDIEVKASQYTETRVDKTKGMKLHKGWYEGFMVNNVKDMVFEVNNCNVLIFDDSIQSMKDFVSYVEYLKGEPILVFCNNISDITLGQIKKWLEVSKYPICFVENDGFGDRKQILLNDLAALTSSYILNTNSKFSPDNLGFANRVRVSELYTSILDGMMDEELINEIVDEIKEKLKSNESNDDIELSNREKKFHQKRLANLTGGVAVIYAGGRTEMEMKELKDRLDDAVLAISSAIRQGVNVGGGYTFINCQNALKSENRGYKLVVDALETPFKQLLINADLIDKVDTFKMALLKGKAIDLRTNEIYNLKKNTYRVYDPTSVLIDSISNAVSVAKSLLSVKTMIYEDNSTL